MLNNLFFFSLQEYLKSKLTSVLVWSTYFLHGEIIFCEDIDGNIEYKLILFCLSYLLHCCHGITWPLLVFISWREKLPCPYFESNNLLLLYYYYYWSNVFFFPQKIKNKIIYCISKQLFTWVCLCIYSKDLWNWIIQGSQTANKIMKIKLLIK